MHVLGFRVQNSLHLRIAMQVSKSVSGSTYKMRDQ